MCYTLLRHGFTAITRSLVTEWGVGKQLNTMMIVFTGVNRLKSCVCTRCFQFDICRVGFIWGYVDGLMQQRRNSGAFSNGEHYVFLALTHRNIHHGTRSRVYHTLTTVDNLVPQGANASADILNTTFSLIFFSASVLAVLHCSWLLIIVSSCTCSVFSKTWQKIWQRKNKNCTTTSAWFQIIKPGNWNKYIPI